MSRHPRRGLFQAIDCCGPRTRRALDPALKLNQKIKAGRVRGGLACYPAAAP